MKRRPEFYWNVVGGLAPDGHRPNVPMPDPFSPKPILFDNYLYPTLANTNP